MTEEYEDRVRKRRGTTEVKQLLAEFESSGMPASEFCQRQGLCRSTLYRYLSLSRSGKKPRRKNRVVASGSQIVPVELASASQTRQDGNGGLALVLASGRTIEVQRGFDKATLERLLDVLERR